MVFSHTRSDFPSYPTQGDNSIPPAGVTVVCKRASYTCPRNYILYSSDSTAHMYRELVELYVITRTLGVFKSNYSVNRFLKKELKYNLSNIIYL